MTSKPTDGTARSAGLTHDALDADSASRIDLHLKRALAAEDDDEKDFHVRHARQLVEACREN